MSHFLFYLFIGAFYIEAARLSLRNHDRPRAVCETGIALLHVGLATMAVEVSILPVLPTFV